MTKLAGKELNDSSDKICLRTERKPARSPFLAVFFIHQRFSTDLHQLKVVTCRYPQCNQVKNFVFLIVK